MEGGGMGHNMKRRTGFSGVLSHHDHDPSHSHYGSNIATKILDPLKDQAIKIDQYQY